MVENVQTVSLNPNPIAPDPRSPKRNVAADQNQPDHGLDLETAARAAWDVRAGRTATDQEWAHFRTGLIQFVNILRAWQRNSSAREPTAA